MMPSRANAASVGEGLASPTTPHFASRPPHRFSALVNAEGQRFVNVETVPPPLERPWWMKVHGDGPAVTNLEEVMDQFLCDSQAQALERGCEHAVKKFDARGIDRVVPGIQQEQLDSMRKWYGHVSKFMKYRSQVAEKHERQMDLRMQRKSQNETWDAFDSEEDSGSDSPSALATPSMRSEQHYGGLGLSGRRPTAREESPSVASGRSSSSRARPPPRLPQVGSLIVKQVQAVGKLTPTQAEAVPTPRSEGPPGSANRSDAGESPRRTSLRRRSAGRISASTFASNASNV